MAWNANEPGNPAWLTKTASEHGGVDQFIDDIRSEGYQEGHDQGVVDGASGATFLIGLGIAGYMGVKHLIEKHKAKKQAIREQAEASEAALRKLYEEGENDTSEDLGVSDLGTL